MKINIHFVGMICFLTLSTLVQAQNSFWKHSKAYLGQVPPEDEPVLFAKEILSDSDIVLGRVTFSKDGKSFYYSFAKHWFDDNSAGTKEIKFNGRKWLEPKVIAQRMTNPALSIDGKQLYLGSGDGKVWLLKKTKTGWTKPMVWLEKPYGLYNFQVTESGAFYVGSNGRSGSKEDWNTYDFCKLTITREDTAINSLGDAVNTNGFDGDFFIAPDESYIIISTKETPTFDSELWISFRKKNKSWTVPQSLGEKINKGTAHRFGQYVTPDGKFLFYTKGTSEADCGIYWVRFDKLLSRLKQNVLSELQ